MNIDAFRILNASAPVVDEGQLTTVLVRDFVSVIDLGRATPSQDALRRQGNRPAYGNIDVGDCQMGLLFDGMSLWGAYSCSGDCAFAGSWCWLMLVPWSFGEYSAEARATYHRDEDCDGWRACAHHSLKLDVAIYTFWHQFELAALTGQGNIVETVIDGVTEQ